MRTINKVILIGNITKDPYVKTTASDKKIATFTIATNRYYKSSTTGESLSEAEYTNCVTWGALADRTEQFLKKGKLIYVEGHLKTRVIDKEDGTKIYRTEVVVDQLIFLSKREDFPTSDMDQDSAINADDFSDLDDRF